MVEVNVQKKKKKNARKKLLSNDKKGRRNQYFTTSKLFDRDSLKICMIVTLSKFD